MKTQAQKAFRSVRLGDGLATLFAVLLLAFLAGKLVAVRTPEHGDQAAYLELAVHLAAGEGFVTKTLSPFYPTKEITHPESIRQPLLPLLLSLSAGHDLSFFLRAKWWVWSLSALCLLVLYLSIRRVWGRQAAFLTVALLGLNPHFHTYASEVWCENLLILWTTAAGILIHEYFRSERRQPLGRPLGIAGAATALGYYTKASAAALAIAFGGVCLVRLVRSLLRRESNERIIRWSLAPLARFALPFGLLLLPYVILNGVNTGTLLRNRDLQAAPWVAHRGEYFLLYDSPPSAAKLLRDEHPSYFVRRLGSGLLAQVANHTDALRISPAPLDYGSFETPFGRLYLVPLLLVGIAIVHLARYPVRGWRGFLWILLAFNFVTAAWYIVIDIAPRFILVSVPFLYLHAALGIQSMLQWVVRKAGVAERGRRWLAGAVYAVPFALLAITLWQGRALFQFKSQPLYANELYTIRLLQGQTPLDSVILTGPSHQLPWYYVFDRRTIFVPNYEQWEPLMSYADTYGADYLLLDQEIYHRRKALFSPYLSWQKGQGLRLERLPPRLEPMHLDPAFMLFRIAPKRLIP